MIGRHVNHVAVWARPDVPPDEISYRFHNMLLSIRPDADMFRMLDLLRLFPTPPPAGRGRYNHHDGYRA